MTVQEDDISKKILTINFSDVTTLGQELGNGAYGRVYTVKYRGNTYAAKEIHRLLQDGAQTELEKRTLRKNFIREYYHCSKLSHLNIVRVIGIYYESQHSLLPVMVMEMMDESLTSYMERLPKAAVKRKGPILLDVAKGLIYLHGQKPDPIVHRDLSPNNILLVKNDQETTVAKIGDLGVAKTIHPNSKSMQDIGKLTRVPGTKDFMPPEAFEDTPAYNTSLDVFSYGGVVLFVATHVWPSPDSERKRDPKSNNLIALNEVQRRQKYLDKMDDEMEVLKPLVEDCLNFDPNKRPTMLQVFEKLKSLKSQGVLFIMPASDRSKIAVDPLMLSPLDVQSECSSSPPRHDHISTHNWANSSIVSLQNERYKSVDLSYYDSNERPPIMMAGSCAQQQRLTKHASFGLSSRGQLSEPSRYNDAYGYPSRPRHGNVNTTQRHAGMVTSDNLGDMLGKRSCSVFSIQNERYKLDSPSFKDHENEDEFLIYANNKSLCMCVFDDHDGSRAVKFVQKYMKGNVFDTKSWMKLLEVNDHKEIERALAEFIKVTDKDFFKIIKTFIDEKLFLQGHIPREMKYHQAQQNFPAQIARLQELESHISGGCTAVVAVLTYNRLYVTNVGDSRAILAYEEGDGSSQVKQLSKDHSVENEQELERLTAIGLDREQMKKSGRLGTQENTRSIGDYSIKGGYRDVDVLSHATDEPGTAIPNVISVSIDRYSFKYLILMSDGVYKTIEAIAGDMKQDGNRIIVTMIE